MTEDPQDKLTAAEEHARHQNSDWAIEHSLEVCVVQQENHKTTLEAIEKFVFSATDNILAAAIADSHADRRFLAWYALGDIFEELRSLADEIELIAAELASDQLSPARLQALRNHNEVNSASWEYGMRGVMKHKEAAPDWWRRFARVRWEASHPGYYINEDREVKQCKRGAIEEDWLEYLMPGGKYDPRP